ncbi:MAG: putative transposase [Gammaproteobacteria bacterium]
MKENNVVELSGRVEAGDALTAMLRSGAQELVRQAVDAELQDLLAIHAARLTEAGRAGVVRNGYLPERQLQTGIGPVTVKVPKVRSKTGEPATFRSALVPPYVRKTRTLEAALPWLYLKGVSSGEMGEALQVLVGPDAKGLSASTVSRLKQVWAKEYETWSAARLDRDRWVYVRADGVYSGLRAEQTKRCALVVIGVNERGEKHFLSIEDGVRESTQSWREVLLKLKSRGMNAPQLAIGDGAMGFWAALEEIYGETRQQRCWMHTSPWMDEVERRRKPKPKTMNVLNCFPKSSQAKVKQSLHAIWQAETKADAETAFDLFITTYAAKYPKAALCLQKDHEELMAFYDFPAQHWQSIRTSNPIESSFATIRHRTKRSKGCLSRDGMLHMMFKLGQCAEKNWRRLRGFDYLAKVVSGIKFKEGIEVTEVNQAAA